MEPEFRFPPDPSRVVKRSPRRRRLHATRRGAHPPWPWRRSTCAARGERVAQERTGSTTAKGRTWMRGKNEDGKGRKRD